MKRVFIAFLLIYFLSLTPGLAYTSDDAFEEIIMYVGQIKAFPANIPRRIVIGKPEIADVTSVREREIAVSAKTMGTTTFVFWDELGEQDFNIKVYSENMRDIKQRVDNLLAVLNLPKVFTKAADSEDKILLLGEVKISQDRERISTALGPLKDRVVDLIKVKEEETVIDIDVQVLELNKDASEILGFTWPGSVTIAETGSPAIATAGFAQVGATEAISGGGTLGTKWGTLFRVLNVARGAFSLKIDALAQEGKARILSRPRLACQSGKEAELIVGGEKPIFATFTTQTSTGATVSYKEYGIKLKIRPTVTEDKRIKLSLIVEVSEVEAPETLGNVARAYPLKKRNVSTELYMDNNQTLAIGGLRKQKSEEDINKTPFAGDTPIFGFLFRKKTTKTGGGSGERGDTELFITLTPNIIATAQRTVAEKEEIGLSAPVIPVPTVPAPSVSPAVNPPSPTTTAVVKETKPSPLQDYVDIVKKRILDNLTYPTSAKAAGFQGTVKLGLRLSYRGELLDVAIKSSSGYSILDDNALSVTKDIVSYPPFPPTIDQKELSIEVPIVYRLD